MKRPRGLMVFVCAAALLAVPPPAFATQDEVRALVAGWYGALRERDASALYDLLAPSAILERPLQRCLDEDSRLCRPVIDDFRLAVSAIRFSYEISMSKVGTDFARVVVSERGWFRSQYGEYEAGAQAIFVLEREERDWRILAQSDRRIGLAP